MSNWGAAQDQKDVELMSDTCLEAYRFSISWSRLIPRGRGPVNLEGLEYYTNLITEITKRGISGNKNVGEMQISSMMNWMRSSELPYFHIWLRLLQIVGAPEIHLLRDTSQMKWYLPCIGSGRVFWRR